MSGFRKIGGNLMKNNNNMKKWRVGLGILAYIVVTFLIMTLKKNSIVPDGIVILMQIILSLAVLLIISNVVIGLRK